MSARHPLIRAVVVALLTVSIAASGVSRVCAQSGEDIAKGLLRALIESQLEKKRRKRAVPDPFRPPGPPVQAPTAEVQQLRGVSATFAQETAALSAVLNTDARRDFRVRQQLPAVLQLEATAAAVRQETANQPDHRQLADSYRQLNSEWLTLSHQLQQLPRLNPQARAVMERLSTLDTQYCGLLGIQQQFDSQQLMRAAIVLAASLEHLEDEVRFHVRSSATRNRILTQLRHLHHQAEYFANLVAGATRPEAVVQEYQRLHQAWVTVEADLDRYDHRPVTRGVQRVVAAQRTIQQLLRLNFGIDRRLVQHLIRDLDQAMLEVFREVSLAELMALPDADEVPTAADTVYGTLQHLADVVQRDEAPQELADSWGYVNESWDLLVYYLTPVQQPACRQHLEEISAQLVALREALGVSVAWDAHAMLQRASALESLADGILKTVRRWHRTAKISDQHHIPEARQLVSCCHKLEQLIAQRRPMSAVRAECDDIFNQWQTLRPHLQECETIERESLDRLAAEFTPELVRIRTLIPE